MDRETSRVKSKGLMGIIAAFCGSFALQLDSLIDTNRIAPAIWLLVTVAAMKALAAVGVVGVAYTDKTLANHVANERKEG